MCKHSYQRFRARPGRHQVLIVVIAVLLTLGAVLVAVNFMTGEKEIEHRLERKDSIDSPQFALELSQLLGLP